MLPIHRSTQNAHEQFLLLALSGPTVRHRGFDRQRVDNARREQLRASETSCRVRTLQKHLRRLAEQHLADGFVMGVARLDLLREGVDVAEAALEGAAGEDRVDSGGLAGPVGDRYGAGSRVGSINFASAPYR